MYVKKHLRFAKKYLRISAEHANKIFAFFTEHTRNARGAGCIIVSDDAVVCAGVLVFDDCAATKKAETAGENDFGVEGRR